MIRYKKYQNQTKSTPLSGKWLARAVADETLDTRALAEHMAKHNIRKARSTGSSRT
jgi:hypothetical protein